MSNKRILTKKDILDVPLRIKEVYIPEWDGIVYIQEMTALQIEQNGRFILKNNGQPDYGKAIQLPTITCVRQVVDQDGNRLFSERDIKELQQKQGGAISRISDAVRELSGQSSKTDNSAVARWLENNYPDIWKEFQEETGAVAEAEANFTTTPSDDSLSD
jgi:hypothetical protein